MGKIVVVAEKPSVGRDIARVLGCRNNGDGCMIGDPYIVTWAVGHLVTLMEPDELDEKYKKWSFETLPILPETIPLKVISSTKTQFSKVKKLINDKETDSLICATDAGREGELIFRYIYEKAGCKKPFQRLWISSMTDEAIREGFQAIRPGADYDGLYESARCRSKADWLVGMNASRAFTLKYDALLSIGRVQTPTLAILVKRRKEIENFKPEGFCTLTADFGDYKGVYFRPREEKEQAAEEASTGQTADAEKSTADTHLKQKADAEKIAAEIKGQTGTVKQAETVRKHELPPQLYDLTSLQRDANRMLGFTADKTLKTAQSLYEKHKALTYPRTDSRYLPPDMIPRVVQTMKLLPDSYQPYVGSALPEGKLRVSKRTVDKTKVTDHHAIIPTARKANPSQFSEDERKLFDMVARRMLAAFYPACDYDATRIITLVGEHSFRTTGRVIVNNGWHDVPPMENPPKARKKAKPDDESESPLPPLREGDTRQVKGSAIREDVTKPPLPHTDASLLAAMETAGRELDDEELVRQMKGSGIGTPATRAAIIERLLHVGYAQRRGKTLLATDKGVKLIDVVPNELSSPELTGRWELALHDITDGKQDPERFMEGIARMSSFLVDYARESSAAIVFPQEQRAKGKGKTQFTTKPLSGAVCPVCGKGGLQESDRAFSCTERDCHCTIWKNCLMNGGGPELTDRLMLLLLEKKELHGSTGVLMIREGRILFYPNGSEVPSVSRPMIWEKKAR